MGLLAKGNTKNVGHSFLDFVPVVKDRQILAVIPRPPEVDPGLFIRYKMCQLSTQLLCETQVKSKIGQILSNSLGEFKDPHCASLVLVILSKVIFSLIIVVGRVTKVVADHGSEFSG